MDDPFARLTRALESRSPLTIDGQPFGLWLIEIADHEPGQAAGAVAVTFGAKSNTAAHTCKLHMSREQLADDAYIVDRAIRAIELISRGDLPPGTREML